MLDAHDGNLLEEYAELRARMDMVDLAVPFRYKDRRKDFYGSMCLLDRALERVELTPELYDKWWAFFNNPPPRSAASVLDALCAFEKNVGIFLDKERWAALLKLARVPGSFRSLTSTSARTSSATPATCACTASGSTSRREGPTTP